MVHFLKIIITRNCNFRCKYCYEKDVINPYNKEETFTKENLDKLVHFLKIYILEHSKDITDAQRVGIAFYGGEAMLYPEKIKYVIDSLKLFHKVICFTIFTNGYNIKENFEILKSINSYKDLKFIVRVSYDFCLQDLQRKKDTHDLIKNNILFLIKNHIFTETLTLVTNDNNKYIDKIYDEYKELYDSLDKKDKKYYRKASWNIDNFDYESLKFFDFSATKQFEYLQKENKTEQRPIFLKIRDEQYNECHIPRMYIYNIYPNGNIYSSETSLYKNDYSKDKDDFYMGNFITNSSKEIFEKQKTYCNSFTEGYDVEICSQCPASNSVCRYQPFLKRNENYCNVMKFLSKYYS